LNRRSALGLIAAPLAGWGCGYRVAGQADTIPDEIRTIAVPAFENGTTEYKIEQYVTQAVKREFLSRTRYAVVNREDDADATLRGAVVSFLALPQNFDPDTGRATTVMTLTRLHVTLWDRRKGVPIYENPSLDHRERYEVSFDPEEYFEERQSALLRSSQSMARTLVSAVLEGF
jgi:hypothetical protein